MTRFSPNKEVIINLENIKSDGCTLYDEKEIIHQEQLLDVFQLLKDRIDTLEYYAPRSSEEYVSKNDIISVFARRGAGKTTFVKTVVELIRRRNGIFGELGKHIHCLDVLEPNSIQKKENLMIRFLAQIEEAFKEKIENGKIDEDTVIRYKKAKEKLYEAMPVIDGVGKATLYPDWDDSAYLADRYMSVAANVKELEMRFHKYIRIGLEILEKKALLFVLDDSDVNISRCFEILEIIRLYFTSPQIIVILTGDAALYGMIVRRKYWEYFDKDFLDKECLSSDKNMNKYDEYSQMVYRLESQYLQKMIKPTHRIFLNNLYDKLQINSKQKVYVKLKYSTEYIEIRKFYENFFAPFDLGKESIRTLDTYISHLLSQPIRDQIRLFSVCDQYLKRSSKEKGMLTMEVLKVFEVYINQCSSDSKFLMSHTPNYPAWLLKFLVENNILEIGSGLLPKMEDDNLNNAIIPLGLSCSDQMKTNAAMIFDYWIRISLTKRLQQLMDKKNNDDKLNSNIFSYASLYSNSGISKILGNMLAYCNGTIIPLRSFSKVQKTYIPGTIIKNRKYYSISTSSVEAKLIHLLQLGTVGGDNHETIIFSIYRPIAVIGEILKIFNSNTEGKNVSEILKYTFIRSCQIKSYIEPSNTPSYEVNKSGGNIIDTYLDKNINQNNIRYEDFMTEFVDWCTQYSGYRVAPHFVDRVFSRYYYTMLNWTNCQEDQVPLGDSICVQVTALWNAALVETMIMLDKIEDIVLDYPLDINQVFLKNYYTFIHTILDFVPNVENLWVNWLLKCPILKKYVSPIVLSLKEDLERKMIDELYALKMLGYEKINKINNEVQILENENNRMNEELNKISERKQLKDKIENLERIIKMYGDPTSFYDKAVTEDKINYIKKLEELKEEKEARKLEFYSSSSNYIDDDDLEYFQADYLNELRSNKEKIRDLQNEMNNVYFDVAEMEEFNNYHKKANDEFSIYSILNHFS